MSDQTTINVDAGGTFTDGFFQYGGEVETVKVPTTKHDLTVCFVECIERGAELFDVSVQELLATATAVRFSTTIGTNTIIEKDGPKLGVLVTKGHEDDLYGAEGQNRVTDAFVDESLVAGVEERVDDSGRVITEPDPEAITETVKSLQERGARLIVIALANSHANNENERAVKRSIESAYPRHYIGSIPTLAAYEVTARAGDYRRLNTATLNAYLHRPMKSSLYQAEDKIRDRGYNHPIFIGHASGGVARVAKSVALNTHNSGPAAGVKGVEQLSRLYGKDIFAADMGGTSIDVSFIRDGAENVILNPEIGGLVTHIPAIEVANYGIGGGSIVTVEGETVSVGPESAGANPGPACFDQGGVDPTVTDADVVLGYVNPEYFLGGRRQLNEERAYAAIEERVAEPLGVSVEEAALQVVQTLERSIGGWIDEVAESVETVAAYGGAGPVHAAGFVSRSSADDVLLTPYSSVFSAFGESTMNVDHTYSRPLQTAERDSVETAIEDMQAEARKDMRAEGYEASDIQFSVDVLAHTNGDVNVHPLAVPIDDADLDELPVERNGSGSTLRLHATGDLPSPAFEKRALSHDSPESALKDERRVYWAGGFAQTSIYAFEDLQPGNVVTGPAVIEATDTTIAVPGDFDCRMNEYGHAVIE